MNRRLFFKTTTICAGGTMLFQGVNSGCEGSGKTPVQAISGFTADKPPLGWNSFDSYGVYLHERAALENLEAMVKKLSPHGYEYFVIDGGWYGEFDLVEGTIFPKEKHAKKLNLNEFGIPQPSRTYFPNGFGEIVRLATKYGIKMGIHLMRGIPRVAVEKNLPIRNSRYTAADVADKTRICSWNSQNYGVDPKKPGAQDWYDSVIQEIVNWGFVFIKYDDLTPYPDEILLVTNALERINNKVVLSLSPGDGVYMPDLPYYQKANLLRTTGDIWDRKEDIDKSFTAWKKFQGLAHAGFWPDLDMIPFGKLQVMAPEMPAITQASIQLSGLGKTRFSRFSNAQMRTFITIRAMAASPLFLGGELTTLDDFSLELITNAYLLECNQNGVCGFNSYDSNSIEVWRTPSRQTTGKGWIGIFNRSGTDKEISLSRTDCGLMHYVTGYILQPIQEEISLRDIWKNDSISWKEESLTFQIPKDDVAFLHYTI